jgi:1-acyl-sn-glycerol-3-phosphate acyltransferase
MPNHVSFLDPFLLEGFVPSLIRGIEREDHFKWPIYGLYIKRFGNIPISQSSPRNALKSFKKATEYLEMKTVSY